MADARHDTEAVAAETLAGVDVVGLLARVAALEVALAAAVAENERLRAENERLRAENEKLVGKVGKLAGAAGKNSGNSSTPPSRDPAVERERQAETRREKKRMAAGGTPRQPGRQKGSKGAARSLSDTPDEVVDHRPVSCSGCGEGLEGVESVGAPQRRQVIEVPKPAPVTTEHRAHTVVCAGCAASTTAPFPEGVRGPVQFGPMLHAYVVYLLARQHVPIERCAEAIRDLCGVEISTGTIDAMYTRASNRLGGFLTALKAVLVGLPVVHADETSDRIGTATMWMHVISTGLFTLIHASRTRGAGAITEAGVLGGYRGVIVHDRLAMYFNLKKAKHGVCNAHLLRDLADVAQIDGQRGWSLAFAELLVEINQACHRARDAGQTRLDYRVQARYLAEYRGLVETALRDNPDPGRKRDYYEAKSFNLAKAFRDREEEVLKFMRNLQVGFTNNQAERDLRPVKLHRKISSCFKSDAGAERFANVRSYLSTTRKHGVNALDALHDLFNDTPWMPPTR